MDKSSDLYIAIEDAAASFSKSICECSSNLESELSGTQDQHDKIAILLASKIGEYILQSHGSHLSQMQKQIAMLEARTQTIH